MNKNSYTIHNTINPIFKVGDKVYVYDGSAITAHEYNETNKNIYIICAYPELTGSQSILRKIEAIVTEINIKDRVSVGSCGFVYLQDIVLKIGNAKFRTNSSMITANSPDPFDMDYMSDTDDEYYSDED